MLWKNCSPQIIKVEWKYWCKACFEISETRANGALLELAVLLRLIDNQEKTPNYIKNSIDCGRLIRDKRRPTKLNFRGAANKIIHAAAVEWCFSEPMRPTIICHSDASEQWRAEINVEALAAFCGRIMS